MERTFVVSSSRICLKTLFFFDFILRSLFIVCMYDKSALSLSLYLSIIHISCGDLFILGIEGISNRDF